MSLGTNVPNDEKWNLKNVPEMDDEQFQLWQALLEDRTGMQLGEKRKSFLQTSLSTRMRELGCSSYEQYFQHLQDGPNAELEWTTLVDRITVQETHFFRHKNSFDLVRDHVVSMIAERSIKSLNLWSVGCSTGEEPYSLAMLIDEINTLFGVNIYFGITATDLSMPALNKARAGIYSERRLYGIETRRKNKYFEALENNNYQVIPAIRDRICFARINVLQLDSVPMENLDVIFCQNLLIYFRRWRRRDIVNRLVERLAPGGLLVLGLGEMTDWLHPELKRIPYENTLAFTRQKTEMVR